MTEPQATRNTEKKPLLQVVLFSSICGMSIGDCLKNLILFGAARQKDVLGPYKVEDESVAAAAQVLDQMFPGTAHTLAQFLSLPSALMCKYSEAGFAQTLKRVREDLAGKPNASLALVSCHPVLFHQRSTEFIQPFQGGTIAAQAQAANTPIRCVVSVHDDIYDIYLRLLQPHCLFDPSIARVDRKRRALRDVQDLLRILSWRDRELSAALALSRGIGCQHFLSHRKGRTKTVWEVACEGKPSVYFSHPISQPRRDLFGIPDPEKCPEPSPERGQQLMDACLAFANLLGGFVPLVEPTAIDEYRLDPGALGKMTELDLRTCVLPPLRKRWPLPSSELLCGQVVPTDDGACPVVPVDRFAGFECSGDNLAGLACAIEMLKDEILRQINVRDHILAEQAGLVVAFRPFSLPNSPEISGGVQKEVEVVIRKRSLRALQCHPGIVIIHPDCDERQRRTNAFNAAWAAKAPTAFPAQDPASVASFRARCLGIFLAATPDQSPDSITRQITRAIAETKVRVSPTRDASSMPSQPILLEEEAGGRLATELLMGMSILSSKLHDQARRHGPEAILFRNDLEPSVKLAKLVAGIVERGLGQ